MSKELNNVLLFMYLYIFNSAYQFQHALLLWPFLLPETDQEIHGMEYKIKFLEPFILKTVKESRTQSKRGHTPCVSNYMNDSGRANNLIK